MSGTFFRAPMSTVKSDSALTDFYSTIADGGQWNTIFGQWVSPPLTEGYSFTTSDTIDFVDKVVVGGGTIRYGWCGRVVSGDGATVRGTFANGLGSAIGNSFPTTAHTENLSYTCGAVTAQVGDRLVWEWGTYHSWSGAQNATMRFGDPSATSDFANTHGLTTDLCPWFQLSPTLVFDMPQNQGSVTLAAVKTSGSGELRRMYSESSDGDYTVRVYDTPIETVFEAPPGWDDASMTADVLVVGGGGGGGGSGPTHGGGGGAGGYLFYEDVDLDAGDTIIIGAGGAGGAAGTHGANGEDSTCGAYTALGGGLGSKGSDAGEADGGGGGSGGGNGAYTQGEAPYYYPGAGTEGQGHDGGRGGNVGGGQDSGGGGGGGASSVGGGASTATAPAVSPGGTAGAGTANSITGASLTYAVGGTGGSGYGTLANGSDGAAGRGNGGGGGCNVGTGGDGGAGTVVIRFLTPANRGLVTLGAVSILGDGHVDAAYTGDPGRVQLGSVSVTGAGRNPIHGLGRLQIGAVRIPLGISANTLYAYCGVEVHVATGGATAVVSGLAADCIISVSGEEDLAWLRDTGEIISLEADALIRVAEHGDTLLNTASLPATDALGWTAPDRDTPALRGLVVTLNGKRVRRELIKDLVIDLSDRGGYDRATLVLDKSVRAGQAAMLSTLRVTYKSTVLFRGRLGARGPTLGHDMQHAMTFTGPIVQLKDHRGFRRVYADSDLSSWQTGQGPNTSANVFEVQGS